MRRRLLILLALAACALSYNAHADLIVCNKSPTKAISVALAYQRGTFITTPYYVSGWEHITPSRCEFMGRGDVTGSQFWLHAVSENTILPLGSRPQFTRLHASDQEFCIADNDFEYESRGAGATHDCAEGRRLATFPITIWHTSDLTDLTIDINPDDFVPQASSQGSGQGPKLPDLYGTIGRTDLAVYTNRFASTEAEGRASVLANCRANSLGVNDPCEPIRYSSFKNQCAAMAFAPNSGVFWVLRGEPDWSEQKTVSVALEECNKKDGGQGCAKAASVCSTYTALSAQKAQQDAQAQQQIWNMLGGALRGLGW